MLKSVLEISVDSGSSDASIAKLDGEERPNITRCLSDGNSKSRAKSSESQKPRERVGEESRGVARETDHSEALKEGERDQSEGESEIFLRQLQALMKPAPLPRAGSVAMQGRRTRSGTPLKRPKEPKDRAIKTLTNPIQRLRSDTRQKTSTNSLQCVQFIQTGWHSAQPRKAP